MRLIFRSPGVVVASVLALGLGIGATTTMFGIVRGGTRSLPVPEPDRIVAVSSLLAATGADAPISPADFQQLQTSLSTLDVSAFRMESVNLGADAAWAADRIASARVTTNTFALLGIAPVRGRDLTADDARPGAPAVVIIADDLWRSRFQADPAVVGTDVRVDGMVRTIVGVMPPRFGFPVHARLWLPLTIDALASQAPVDPVQVAGRLRGARTIESASTELAAVFQRFDAAEPPERRRTTRAVAFGEIETPPEVLIGLRVLVAIVSLVLLVASANVANLLLARAAARSRDFAIRTALGASRGNLVVQQLGEAGILASCATALGIGAAAAGLSFFRAESAGILDAFWMDFRVDALVAVFAGALGFVAAFASGLLPAIRASRVGVSAVLAANAQTTSGLRMGRLGRGLVAAQVALACGALLLTTTFVGAAGALRGVAIPFPSERVLTAQLSVPASTIGDGPRRTQLLADLRDRLTGTPEIRRVAFVSVLPGRGAGGWPVQFADAVTTAATAPSTAVMAVTPDFFDLATVHAVRGRVMTWQDDSRAPLVAVVNESFVLRHSAARDPIGRRLRLGTSEYSIVGVVPDLLMQDIEDRDAAGFYVSMLQQRPLAVRVMAETNGPAIGATAALRRGVEAVDRDLPVFEIAPLREAIFSDKKILDALAGLFLVFGSGAIFLAALSLYAVQSFVITERRREFGIRTALGASPRDLAALLVKRGGVEVAWGLSIGLALAFGLSRVLAATIERAPSAGFNAFAAIAVTVASAALLAMWRPLRRIVRLNAASLLRS